MTNLLDDNNLISPGPIFSARMSAFSAIQLVMDNGHASAYPNSTNNAPGTRCQYGTSLVRVQISDGQSRLTESGKRSAGSNGDSLCWLWFPSSRMVG